MGTGCLVHSMLRACSAPIPVSRLQFFTPPELNPSQFEATPEDLAPPSRTTQRLRASASQAAGPLEQVGSGLDVYWFVLGLPA